MMDVKKILAPTDLSDLSSFGVGHALQVAAGKGSEVILYRVVTQNELVQFGVQAEWQIEKFSSNQAIELVVREYESALERFLEKHHSNLIQGVKVRRIIDFGKPAKNIVKKAKEERVDLIVISTHGRSGLPHVLIGSVAEKVVRHASCPVLTIRPQKVRAREEAVTAG